MAYKRKHYATLTNAEHHMPVDASTQCKKHAAEDL